MILDYWPHLDVHIYDSVEDFFAEHKGKKMAFLSTHGEKEFWDIDFEDDMFLVFGKESTGLDKELLEDKADRCYRIPLLSDKVRSLNLANAVGIVVYEGIRRLGISG